MAEEIKFSYSNHDSGFGSEGCFLMSQVSGWNRLMSKTWYNIYFKNAGCQHSIMKEDFDRFKALWDKLNS